MMKYRALRTLTEPERGTEQTQKQKPKQTFSFQLSFVHVISEVIGQKRLNGENLRGQDCVWQKKLMITANKIIFRNRTVERIEF